MPRQKFNKTKPSYYVWIIIVLILLASTVIYYLSKKTAAENVPLPQIKTTIANDSAPNLLDVIRKAALSLDIDESELKIRNRPDDIYIKIPINRDKTDLCFVNALITGKIEERGGIIKDGRENNAGNIHNLVYYAPDEQETYTLKLYYKKSDVKNTDKELCIIIDDFGEKAGTLFHEFLELDPAVTFAILPDLTNSKKTMELAVKNGHETIIHLPMEPINYPVANPGENAIFIELEDKEIEMRLQSFYRQLPLCIGVNNHMGSLATSDERVMRTVISSLKKAGLFFIDSRTSASSIAHDTAQRMQVATAKRDMFIDVPAANRQVITKKLAELNNTKKNKYIAITHCFDKKRLELLKIFIKEAQAMGWQLIPVSQAIDSKLPEI